MEMPRADISDVGSQLLLEELRGSVAHTNLPKLLRYEDRNSMIHSIESRVPFLEPNMANFVFSLPESLLVTDEGLTKAVFRHAMDGIVPATILDRTDKIGFDTPEEKLNLAMQRWAAPYFDGDEYELPPMFDSVAMHDHLDNVTPTTEELGFPVWRIRNFVSWYHMFGIEHDESRAANLGSYR